jgi:hypothetical protein
MVGCADMVHMEKISIAANKNIRLIGETVSEINLLEETEHVLF